MNCVPLRFQIDVTLEFNITYLLCQIVNENKTNGEILRKTSLFVGEFIWNVNVFNVIYGIQFHFVACQWVP